MRKANWRQYFLYLGLNVAISTITVLIVLSLWDNRDRSAPETPTATVDVMGQVASVLPTITPTKVPSPTPHIYIVRGGDTLSNIAEAFDISVEDLMAANRLENANTLSAGQELIIPGDGPDPGTGAVETAEPAEVLTQGDVIINAIEAPGNHALEAVRLLNAGGEVSMAGWVLEDGQGKIFTFPDFTFYGTGAIDVHTRPGTNTTIDLYWGLDEAVWTAGTTIMLRDASGILQSSFTIPNR